MNKEFIKKKTKTSQQNTKIYEKKREWGRNEKNKLTDIINKLNKSTTPHYKNLSDALIIFWAENPVE